MTSALRRILPLLKLPESMAQRQGWFLRFLFPDETDLWVSILRIGLGIQVVLYALSLKDDWNSLFGGPGNGLVSRAFSEALLSRQSPFVPRLGWLVALGAHAGLPEWTVLSIAWWTLLFAGCGLVAGIFSRPSAIVAWLIHLCATTSGSLVSYGVDNFMTIGLFYLMFAPLPDRYALEQRWLKARNTGPTAALDQRAFEGRQMLGFWRRVLQVHLCLIYFFGGLSKALGNGWWNGTSLWRALTRSPFNLLPAEALIGWKYIFPIAGIAIFVLEMGYPIFIWRKRTRLPWLVCIIAMHIGIGVAMGMYLFALIMIVLNVAAFGPRLDWRSSAAAEQPENDLIDPSARN